MINLARLETVKPQPSIGQAWQGPRCLCAPQRQRAHTRALERRPAALAAAAARSEPRCLCAQQRQRAHARTLEGRPAALAAAAAPRGHAACALSDGSARARVGRVGQRAIQNASLQMRGAHSAAITPQRARRTFGGGEVPLRACVRQQQRACRGVGVAAAAPSPGGPAASAPSADAQRRAAQRRRSAGCGALLPLTCTASHARATARQGRCTMHGVGSFPSQGWWC